MLIYMIIVVKNKYWLDSRPTEHIVESLRKLLELIVFDDLFQRQRPLMMELN